MIKTARLIPDKLAQIKIIQSYVQTIPYDYDEMHNSRSDLDHRTLKQALENNFLICDEAARLKLFVLEKLNYNQNDIRWVGMHAYAEGKNIYDHAVLDVKVKGQVWTMTIASPTLTAENSFGEKAVDMAINISNIETAAVNLGWSHHSYYRGCVNGKWGQVTYVPLSTFNSSVARQFDIDMPKDDLSNIPSQLKAVTAANFFISREDLKKYGALKLLTDAIARSYQQQASRPSNHQNQSLSESACG